jgi:Sec-independent protein translocase protein TatA
VCGLAWSVSPGRARANAQREACASAARLGRPDRPGPLRPTARPGANRAATALARAARRCYGLRVFGIGVTEMILVGIVVLMLFSPRELPGVVKTLARVYGSVRRTAEQFRAQVMEADELREPIEEIRQAYHGTKAEIASAKDLARLELQRARSEVMKAQQKINELAREEAKRAPALGDRVAQPGPGEQVPAASSAPAPSPVAAAPVAPVPATPAKSDERDVA